eukprot:TRINITY_DN4369_c0_g1_i1.p3 TRINITY_DN4369_c0_g1~~TRINITY_DN4369_c0_g1_i1.p3  ORF type:complete len:62 (+),score=2.72 TRINITY_DN4369_c0_g1_i1:563-748(+)
MSQILNSEETIMRLKNYVPFFWSMLEVMYFVSQEDILVTVPTGLLYIVGKMLTKEFTKKLN